MNNRLLSRAHPCASTIPRTSCAMAGPFIVAHLPTVSGGVREEVKP